MAQVFSYEFFEISNNTFFTEHLWATASEQTEYFAGSPPKGVCEKTIVESYLKLIEKHMW